MTRTAIDLGSERVANVVALGALAALTGLCERAALEATVRAETPRAYVDLNLDAVAAGFRMADDAGTRA
jgi:2-oxoglutarate ferredoxin oxidoreductase subunit gamma